MSIASFLNSLPPATCDLSWQEAAYQHMHRYPELSGREEKTAAFIRAQLDRFDCRVTTDVGGHGLVAVFDNGEGPVALMRADFDALPVSEETGADFASTERVVIDDVPTPVMHACGHDMHTTGLLGACQILDGHREAWRGTFVAVFQPSEENGAGAQAMVADGLSEMIPRPDVCFGQHIVAGPAGAVMSMPGAALATCDSIEIRLTGKSAHGSMPHNSIDPTYVAAMIVVRLQGIVGREIAPHEFAVVSVGTLQSGHSNNTIPGEGRIVLNCRSYSEKTRTKLYAAIERVVRAECIASGMTIEPEISYFAHGPLTYNNPHVFTRVREQFDGVFGPDSFTAKPWTASEDFSNLPDAFGAPYLFWTVGATPREQWEAAVAADAVETTVPVNHMSTFLPDFHPTVAACTKAAATAVLTYLGNPDL